MGVAWSQSGQLAFDNSGNPAAGALAFIFQGGTTTPLTVFSDAAEATPRTHPVAADANGRWPVVFIPFSDTGYDVKVTTAGGTQLYYFENIPNANPVEAAEDTVDASDLIQTGDVIWTDVGGTRTGFVRCNGRTIGNAASGATERANADTEDLFLRRWNGLLDAQAAVSGGRGASAAADYAANKTIALPDLRFATIKGVADMGNSQTTVNGQVTVNTGNANTAGASVGAQVHTLTTAQLASHTHDVGTYATAAGGDHTHGGATSTESQGHVHNVGLTPDVFASGITATAVANGTSSTPINNGGGAAINVFTTANFIDIDAISVSGNTAGVSQTHTHAISTSGTHTHTVTGASASEGSGTAHNNESPAILGTFFMRL
jgi:hypothetical protein